MTIKTKIRYFLLVVIALCIFSCTTINTQQESKTTTQEYEQEYDTAFFESLLLFTYSDISQEMNDYTSVDHFLTAAVDRTPDSVFLNSKLLQNKVILASQGKIQKEEVVQLGDILLKNGAYNLSMLSLLGRYFTQISDQKQAKKYFEAGLKLGADREFNYSYYVYLQNFSLPGDSLYLAKVIEEPWQDKDANLIYKAGIEYSRKYNVLKGVEVLLKGYLQWDSEQFVHSINWRFLGYLNQSIRDLLLKLEKEDKLTKEMLELLLMNYGEEQDYDAILALENACRRFGDEYSMRMLYFAAISKEKFQLATEIGELLLLEHEILPEAKIAVLSSLSLISYGEGDWEKTEEYLWQIDNCISQFGCISSILIEYPSIEMLKSFMEQQYRNREGEEQNKALLYLALINLNENDKLEEILSLLPRETFDDILCIRLVTHNLKDSDITAEAREQFTNYFEKDKGLTGLYYYYLGEENKALENFRDAASQEELTLNEFFIYHEILSEKPAGDELLLLLKNAAETFPDSSVVLNLYGYSVADYQWEKEYSQAGEALLKALEMEPDNYAYWDSIGWLYYRLGRYDEALAAMEHTAKYADGNDVILYHYGVILSVKGKYTEAKEYLDKVLELTEDEELKDKVEETLNVLKKINQEDNE